MRSRLLGMTAALLLASAPAIGQEAGTSEPTTGSVDIGGRIGTVDGDDARFQRFRDFRDGAFLDNVRYVRDTERWLFEANANNVGYRDQRYEARFNQFGKLKVSFTWDQVPLFYSVDTATPFTEVSPGVFRVPDQFQAAVQAGELSRYALNDLAAPFDLRSRRDSAELNLEYNVTRDLDLQFRLLNTMRDGAQNWMAPFGFNNAIELRAPVDSRTTDLMAGVEWANRKGMVRVAYDGSWYDNHVERLVWDNPIRITDITVSNAYLSGNAASQGQMTFWPNSTAHTISGTGSVSLPARSRAYAHLSRGAWLQDDALLPHTINTVIPSPALERPTAEAEAEITAATLGFVSRPTNLIWFNARYRYYDYNNTTPHIGIPDIVRFDGVAGETALGGPEPFSYSRNFFDADVSLTPSRFVAFRAGYGLETDDRTFRVFEETTENTFRASVDSTGLRMVTVRGVYEYSKRTGDGLDEQVLDDIGEQVSLRQFDISDRTRNRFSGVVHVMPLEMVAFSATAGVGRDNRPDAAFGLQDNDQYFLTVGFDAVPSDAIGVGVQYGYEHYSTLQASRQANPGPQFDDPTRDWFTDYEEKVNNIGAYLDLLGIMPKTDLRLGYDWNRASGRYLYLLPANTTLSTPQQLPELLDELTSLRAELQYRLTRRIALRVAYLFEDFNVDDYAFAPTLFTQDSLVLPVVPPSPNTTYLQYMYRPYTANTGWIGIRYFW